MQVGKKITNDVFWNSNLLSLKDIFVINVYLLVSIICYGIVYFLILKRTGLSISQYRDLWIYTLWSLGILGIYKFRIKNPSMLELKSHFSKRNVTFVFSLIFFIFFTKGVARILIKEYMSVDKENIQLFISDHIFFFLFHAFIAITLGPIIEEIIFRGFFYPPLRKKFGHWAGIIITSLLFTIWHIGGGMKNIVCIFFLGVLFGFIFEKTRSLTLSIIAHSFFNLNWIIAIFFNIYFKQNIFSKIEIILTSLYLILFIICVFFNKKFQAKEKLI